MRATILLLAIPAGMSAQMPGVPVLQNAWATPGLVGAVNVGGGSGSTTWAGAFAWSPPTARWQVSVGGGAESVTGAGSHGVYGARVAVPIFQLMGGKVGLGAFAGFGGSPRVPRDSTALTSEMPVGVSIGFRQPMGAGGVSVYATPSYQHVAGGGGSSNAFRVGTGVDVGLTRTIGVTAGLEFGQSAPAGKVGIRGTRYGIGASYAAGKR